MDATNGIVKELQAENERLQKQLQEARAACNLYENELIALRMKVDDMMLEDLEPRFIFERLAGNWSGYGVIWDTVLSGYFVSENTRCNGRYEAHKFMVEDGLNATDNLNDMEKYNTDDNAIHNATVASQVASHELHIANEDDTQEMDVEPVDMEYHPDDFSELLHKLRTSNLFEDSAKPTYLMLRVGLHRWQIQDTHTEMYLQRFVDRPAQRVNTGWTHLQSEALEITDYMLVRGIVNELNAYEATRRDTE